MPLISRLIAATAVLSVLPLAACSLSADDKAADKPGAPAPAASAQAKPSQPFDILEGGKVGLIEAAETRLEFACMAKAGFPQNQEIGLPETVDPFAGLTIDAASLGPTTEQQARDEGFGQDQPAERPALVSSDKNYDAAAERCADQSWKTLGADARQTVYAYYDLTNQFAGYRHELDTRLPASLGTGLYGCITGKGYKVPDRDKFVKSPNPRTLGVPFGQLDTAAGTDWAPKRKPGSVEVGPAVPARHYRPTAAESDLAVAWFHCRQQAKMLDAYLTAARPVQQSYVDRYESQITELNAKVDALAREVGGATR
jgi:hypothetical protein